MSSARLTSGSPAPSAGIYAIYNADGTLTGDTITIRKAKDPMPRTERHGQYYERVRLWG